MKVKVSILCIYFLIFITGEICSQTSKQSAQYLKGYNMKLSGEDFIYHSPQPDATKSLLVRSVDSDRYIEWKTQAIPSNYNKKRARFILIAAIDVNTDSHNFNIFLNDEKYFTIKNPENNSIKNYLWKGKNGTMLEFKSTMTDRHGDQMGYMFLDIPTEHFAEGKPITVKVIGENAGSQSWLMIFKYNAGEKLKLFSENAIIREKDKNVQLLRVDIVHLDKPSKAIIQVGDQKIKTDINLGYNSFKIKLPVVESDKNISVNVKVGNNDNISKNIIIKPVKQKTIYLLHHSHVDIGYTHVQKVVEDIHWKYFEQVIELAKNSKDQPAGSQFKWNVEVMWAVESYLNNASSEKKADFIDAVKKGWIGLDAFYGNELTGLCNTEELVRLTESARKISKMCGVNLESAMITDVPGWTWGIVPVLALSNVKYISMGTNFGHRIGGTIEKWGDRPFYWVSPSGEEKILCWIHEKAYSMFHSGLDKAALKFPEAEKNVFNYLSEMDENNYPYDIIPLRYNIGSDNGPPDPDLAKTVMDWNNRYVSPKLIIATTTEMFKAFEKKYADKIPVVKGDFTPYWEDGAASSAKETVINRRNADRMIQAEALWSILKPYDFPEGDFNEAWKNIMLYDEHTWGSWNSISDPENDFTISQWEHKKQFAINAKKQSSELINLAVKDILDPANEASTFEIFNTNSWDRTDLVFIPSDIKINGNIISDERGNFTPIQQLSGGEHVFIAKNVPALGSKTFYIRKQDLAENKELIVNENYLINEFLNVKIDKTNGSIKSLKHKDIPHDLVDNTATKGLNSYFYIKGRKPDKAFGTENVRIKIKEKGPVIVSLLIESEAEGCYKLSREVQLFSGINRINIINTVDKKKIYNQESIHFGFPFNIKEGKMNIDIVYGYYRPEHDQLEGACKNYFTVEDWVDISNQDYGITWASPDAPLIEIGDITTDPVVYGWLNHIEESQLFYSYVMNNYWETNYRAAQQGEVKFRYSIMPHKQFIPSDAEKFGIEQNQPLIAIPVKEGTKSYESIFTINNNGIIVTSVKPLESGKGIIIKLFNSGGMPEKFEFIWKNEPTGIFLSNFDEEIIDKAPQIIKIPAMGIRVVLIEY
ncbi:glycoside hydrolase family 38 C-terminal domain-containing protein [Bacteroidota bacterium]